MPIATVVILILTLGGSHEQPPPGPPGNFFAQSSVWNAPLPAGAALDPTSAPMVGGFTAEIANERSAGTGPWIQTTDYSTPIYRVGADQATVPVKLDSGAWGASLQAVFAQGVPIPPDAKPANGTDAHMTIYQPSRDRLWEFWRASKQADGWHAAWGGAMEHVSTNPGYYTPAAWPGAQPNWGSTATSLPVAGGTVLISELRRGRIPHALALAVPDARAGVFAWPAQRTDGSGGPTTLPEGARLRLDPKLDIARLNLSPTARMLAAAAQRYGIVVRDRTHHATTFYAEAPGPNDPDPYTGSDGLFGDKLPTAVLEGFPWDHLRLLKMTLCQQSPCGRGGAP